MNDSSAQGQPAPRPTALFVAFAFGYFFSALLRAIAATLAPVFSAELQLGAADLGLLAGAFFFGFASVQLPLGSALDRFGPRRTLLGMMSVAVLACAAFALAPSLPLLVAARVLMGAGLGASLMAALTSYRHWYSPAAQLRANSWMLMTGSLGMLASTLPVQALLPLVGWRGLFWLCGGLLLLAMALIAWIVPADRPLQHTHAPTGGYAQIWRHPMMRSMGPLGFFNYGGMIAIQSLWAGPWLTRVAGWSAIEAAQGLFFLNLSMLMAFMSWGAVMPGLSRRGWNAERLMVWGLPWAVLLLAAIVALGGGASAVHWALWCVLSTFVSVSQPAIGAAFSTAQAGRALSAYNLVIFSGVFAVQWGLGLAIDGFLRAGLDEPAAFRAAIGIYGLCCGASYLWFLSARRRSLRGGAAPAAVPEA